MNEEEREYYLRKIEHTLREAEYMMRNLHPNFNNHRNAEIKANSRRKYGNRDKILERRRMSKTFYSNGAYCLICRKEYTESCFWNKHIFGVE